MGECIVRELVNGKRSNVKGNDILKPDRDG